MITSGASSRRRACSSSFLRVFGWKTGISCSSASVFTGGAVRICLRPCGLSGWVYTAQTSCPASMSACRLGTAKSGVPMNTIRIIRPHRPAYPPVDVLLDLLGEQMTVQMLGLVAEALRYNALALTLEPVAIAVLCANLRPGRTGHIAVNARHGQAALDNALEPFCSMTSGFTSSTISSGSLFTSSSTTTRRRIPPAVLPDQRRRSSRASHACRRSAYADGRQTSLPCGCA